VLFRSDYIDDVSTTYFDKRLLRDQFGDASASLSDPSLGEKINYQGDVYHAAPESTVDCQTCPNQQRGDPTNLDSYMFLNFSVNYRLKSTRKGLPKF
jgi:hypothetical protein